MARRVDDWPTSSSRVSDSALAIAEVTCRTRLVTPVRRKVDEGGVLCNLTV